MAEEAKLEPLRKAGLPVDALNERLVTQLGKLSDDEVKALVAIRRKLNTGLDERIRRTAGDVGVIVW